MELITKTAKTFTLTKTYKKYITAYIFLLGKFLLYLHVFTLHYPGGGDL